MILLSNIEVMVGPEKPSKKSLSTNYNTLINYSIIDVDNLIWTIARNNVTCQQCATDILCPVQVKSGIEIAIL